MSSPGVLLFIDNSNIFISGKDVAELRDGAAARYGFRLHFPHLLELALAGRPLRRAYVVGSIPPEERSVWDRLEHATGVRPELYERGSESGKEQGLDQCLQVNMLRAISDYDEPQIVILLTGDGSGYDDGAGFHADLERMHRAGWGVEVLSWNKSCKRALKEWATLNGVFIALDDHYDSISFVKNGRRECAVDLLDRPVTQVRESPAKAAERRARHEETVRRMAAEKELEALRAQLAQKQRGKERHLKRFERQRR